MATRSTRSFIGQCHVGRVPLGATLLMIVGGCRTRRQFRSATLDIEW